MPGARRVGARGNPEAPLVILGESPGVEELKFGAPFVGPSGELLMKNLPDTFNIDEMAFVLNAMQCRPPKTSSQLRDKDYKTRACAACRSRVLEQVFRAPRKCVLALGAWANSALLGDYAYKITQRRGEPYEATWLDPQGTLHSTVVVPAVHPAFLLRGSGNPKTFLEDVKLALKFAYPKLLEQVEVRGEKGWIDPEFVVLDTTESVRRFKEQLSALGPINVAADIETSGFNFLTDDILCIGFYTPMDSTAYIIPGPKLRSMSVGLYVSSPEEIDPNFAPAVKQLLELPNIRYIWQFGKFDEKFLLSYGLISEDWGIKEDTGLLSYAISEATRDHDLDEQAKNILGAPNHKDALKKWAPKKTDSYSKVPPEALHDYLAKDVKKTYLLWEHNRPVVRSDAHLDKLYTRTLVPASHLLARVERRGIQVDWDYVRINREGASVDDVHRGLAQSLEAERGLEHELVEMQDKLTEMIGYRVNPNSPGEVAELLYDRIGLTIKGKRPNDTRKETLDRLPPHPVVNLLKKYRSMTKMLSTYVAAIEDLAVNDRVHTTFKLHASTTGRLSSSEPNIQNIPRDPRWRRMYRSKPGYVLIESDYNSAELRMLAALSGDEFLTGVFLDGERNLHDEVSVAMYGENFTRDQRIRAKAINFGIPYGRKAGSVAEEFDMPGIEAQRLINAWFARAPGAAKFLKFCSSAPLRGQTLITVFGRKRRPGIVSQERVEGLQNEFANFNMQSPISDFTLHSAIELDPQLESYDAGIVNLVHDSLVIECPEDPQVVYQVATLVRSVMQEVPTYWIDTPIQFITDLKVGTNWGMGEEYKPELLQPQLQPRKEVVACQSLGW